MPTAFARREHLRSREPSPAARGTDTRRATRVLTATANDLVKREVRGAERSLPQCRRLGSIAPAAALVVGLVQAEVGRQASSDVETTQNSWEQVC